MLRSVMMRAASKTVISGLALWVSRVFTTSDTLAILYSFDRNSTLSGSLTPERQASRCQVILANEPHGLKPSYQRLLAARLKTVHFRTGSSSWIKKERTRFQAGLELVAGVSGVFAVVVYCASCAILFTSAPSGPHWKRLPMYESKRLCQLPCMETGVLFYLTSPHHKEEH